MKFSVSFKTPDAVDLVIKEELEYETPDDEELHEFRSNYDDPVEAWREEKEQELRDFVQNWVQHGECVTIEFDTRAGTATVQTVK